MYGGKHIATGDAIFVFERKSRRAGSHREGRRHLGQTDRKEGRDRPANATGEHHRQKHRGREAALRTKRAQTFLRLERRPAGDGAQFQIVPSGDQQNRWHLG